MRGKDSSSATKTGIGKNEFSDPSFKLDCFLLKLGYSANEISGSDWYGVADTAAEFLFPFGN